MAAVRFSQRSSSKGWTPSRAKVRRYWILPGAAASEDFAARTARRRFAAGRFDGDADMTPPPGRGGARPPTRSLLFLFAPDNPARALFVAGRLRLGDAAAWPRGHLACDCLAAPPGGVGGPAC